MVSVVIPAYNRAGTIIRSVQSVLNQTYDDLEVIVVDDCSDDNLEDVLKELANPKVRYVRLDSRSGACVARNRGVQESRGEYIAFQDSDDEWTNDKLAIQLKAMSDNNADVCFCRVRRHYIGENAKVILWPESISMESCFMDHITLRRKSYVSTQTIVAKGQVFDEILFDPAVKKSQDYDWMIRASEKFSVYYVAEPLVEQYLQPDSISLSGYGRFVESRQYFLEKYRDLCEEDPQFKLHLLKQLAYYKSLDNQNATEEYRAIYSIEKNFHNAMCVFLSSSGMMRLLRNIQNGDIWNAIRNSKNSSGQTV